ncbi:choice-of-anchor D domain-containing protein, partial [candidate division KSB1 bacterium]
MKSSNRYYMFILAAIIVLTMPAMAWGQTIMGEFEDNGATTKVFIYGPDVPTSAPTTMSINGNNVTGITHFYEDPPGEWVIGGMLAGPIANFPEGTYDVQIDTFFFANVSFTHHVGGGPMLFVDPSYWDFGMVDVGNFADKTIRLQNDGDADLDISGISIMADPGDYNIQNPPGYPYTLTPGSFYDLNVRYSPTSAGFHSRQLEIFSNDPGSPFYVTLDGEGNAAADDPEISVTEGSLYFGMVDVGTSANLPIQINNDGTTGDLVVTSITSSGAYFSVNATFPINIGPGGSVNVDVEFNPPAAQYYMGNLEILRNAINGSPFNFSVSGDGQATGPPPPDINVTQSNIPFGEVAPLTSSASMPLDIQNNDGANPVDISFDMVSPEITITPAWPYNIGASGSQTFQVTFDAPAGGGTFNGSFDVMANGTYWTSITYNATSSASTPGEISVTPNPFYIGSTTVGSSVSAFIDIWNNGDDPFDVTSMTATPAGTFNVLTATPFAVPGNSSYQIEIQYNPSAVGPESGNLQITNTSSNNTNFNLGLDGDGESASTPGEISVTPNPFYIGSTTVGSSVSAFIDIWNNGDDPFDVTSMTATPAGTFDVLTATPFAVPGNSSYQIEIQYNPSAAGAESGNLQITNTSSNMPSFNLGLDGDGNSADDPTITVTEGTLNFGNATEYTTSTLSIQVNNTGTTGDLVVNSITFTDASFSTGQAFPFNVGPGGSVNVNIDFYPAGAGYYSGDLNIWSNATNVDPYTLFVDGTGEAAASAMISVAPNPANMGDIAVGSNGTFYVNVWNSGSATLNCDLINLGNLPPEISVVGATTFSVPANSGHDIQLDFNPSSASFFNGWFDIQHDGTNTASPLRVDVDGNGITATPIIDVNPDPYSFGNFEEGTPSHQQTFTIDNTSGTDDLYVSAVYLDGPEMSAYMITGSAAPMTISPGGLTTFQVTFTPYFTGPHYATLHVMSDDPAMSDVAISLDGNGEAAAADPITVTSMGMMTGGAGTTELWVYGTNFSDTEVWQVELQYNGAMVNDWMGGSLTITPGSIMISIAQDITTMQNGDYQAYVYTNTQGTFNTPMFNFTGGTGGGPDITITQSSFPFTDTEVGSTSQMPLNITNNSTTNSVEITFNVTQPEISVTPATFTIPPSGSNEFTVTFSPSASGFVDGGFDVNADGSFYQQIFWDGNGTVAASPITVTSMELLAGASAGTTELWVYGTNLSDTEVWQVDLTFDPNGTNQMINDWMGGSLTITPGSIMISIAQDITTFQNGDYEANVYTNTQGTFTTPMYTFTGGGGGGGPIISADMTYYDFATVDVGQFADYTFTIYNTGDQPLDVTSYNFAPTGEYTMETTFPLNIAAGGQQQITVRFSPTTDGLHNTFLQLWSNDTNNNPFDIEIDGTGQTTGGGAITVTSMELLSGGAGETELWVYGTNFSAGEVTQLELQYNGALYDDWPTAELTITPGSIMVTIGQDLTAMQNGDYNTLVHTSAQVYNTPMYNFTGGTGGGGGAITVDGMALMPGAGGSGTELWVYGTNFSETEITQVDLVYDPGGSDQFLGDWMGGSLTITPTSIMVSIAQELTTFQNGNYSANVYTNSFGTLAPPVFNFTGGGSGGGPMFEVTPSDFNFGTISVGTTASNGVVTVYNTGDADLEVTSITFNPPGDFVVTSATSFTVPPAGFQVVNFDFSPTAGGYVSASMEFNTNVGYFANAVFVDGEGDAGGGGITIWGGSFEVDSLGQDIVILFGDGYVAAGDLTGASVNIASTWYTLTGFQEGEDSDMPGEFKVVGMIAYDVSTLTEANYDVRLESDTEGILDFNIWMDVFAGGGGGDITFNPTYLDFGEVAPGTSVDMPFEVFNNTGAAADISFDIFQPELTIAPASMNIADGLSFTFTVTFSPPAAGGFYDGGFDIVVNGTENIPVGWEGNSPTAGGGITLWGGSFEVDSLGQDIVILFGDGYVAAGDLTGASVDIAGTWYQLTGFHEGEDPEMPGEFKVVGMIAYDVSTLGEANYDVRLESDTEGTLDFNVWMDVHTGGGPTGFEIWSGAFEKDSLGNDVVTLWGGELPASGDLTSASVNVAGTDYTLTSFYVEEDPTMPGDFKITGNIAVDVNTLTPMNYDVNVTSAAHGVQSFNIWMDVNAAPVDQPWIGGVSFEDLGGGQISVEIWGEDFDLADITTVEVGDDSTYTGLVFSSGMPAISPSQIEFTTAYDFADLVSNFYFVRITTTDYGILESDAGGHWWDVPAVAGPVIWSGSFEKDSLGNDVVTLWGGDYPGDGDLTVAAVNIDGAEYTLTSFFIEEDPTEPGDFKITGNIAYDVSMLASANYDITIESTIHGVLDFNIWMDVYTSGGPTFEIFGFSVAPDPGNNAHTEFRIDGTGFTSVAIDYVEIWYYDTADQLFDTYSSAQLNINDTYLQAIYADDMTTLPTGDFWARVYLTDASWLDSPSQYVDNSGGGTAPMIWSLEFEDDGGGMVRVTAYGDGFEAGDITLMQVSDNAAFTGGFNQSIPTPSMTIDWDMDEDKIEGTFAYDFTSLASANYYVKLTSTLHGNIDGDVAGYWWDNIGGGTGFQIWGGEFVPLAGPTVEVAIYGMDWPATGDISSVVISDGVYTLDLTGVQILQDTEDPTDYYLEGMLNSTMLSTLSFGHPPDGVHTVTVTVSGTDEVFDDVNFNGFEIMGGKWELVGSDTHVGIGGFNFPPDITSSTVTIGGNTLSGIATMPDSANPDDIIVSGALLGVTNFATGDYALVVNSPEHGTFTFDNVYFDQSTGGGGNIIVNSMDLMPDSTGTQTELWVYGEFTDPSDITQVELVYDDGGTEIFIGDWGGTALTISDWDIKVVINQDISLFQTGNYKAKVYTNSYGTPETGWYFFDGGGGTGGPIMVGNFNISAGSGGSGTEFWVYGSDFLSATIDQLEIAYQAQDSAITVYTFAASELTITDNEIMAFTNDDPSTLQNGIYWAVVFSDGNPYDSGTFDFNEGVQPFKIDDGKFLGVGTDTEVELYGLGIPPVGEIFEVTITHTTLGTFIGNGPFEVSFYDAAFPEKQMLKFTLTGVDYSTFIEDDYSISVDHSGGSDSFPDIWMAVGMGGPEPDIWSVELIEDTSDPNNTIARFYGENFDMISQGFFTGFYLSLDDSSFTTNTYFSDLVSIFPNPGGDDYFDVEFTNLLYSSLPEQEMFIKIQASGESDKIWSFWHTSGGGTGGPQIWGFGFQDMAGGQVGVTVFGDEFIQGDIISVEISDDSTFMGAVNIMIDNPANIVVTQDYEGTNEDKIESLITYDFASLSSGDYYVRLVSSSHGTIFDGQAHWWDNPGGGTGSPIVNGFGFWDEGAGQVKAVVFGEGFTAGTVTFMEISNDDSFAGSFYVSIANPAVIDDGAGGQNLEGYFTYDFSMIPTDTYYIRVTTTTDGVISDGFGHGWENTGGTSGGDDLEIFTFNVTNFDATTADVSIYGENFESHLPRVDSLRVVIGNDTTYTLSFYELSRLSINFDID